MLTWERSRSSILLMGGESRSCPRSCHAVMTLFAPVTHPETRLDGEIDSLMGWMGW
jgi:hypothetical protein